MSGRHAKPADGVARRSGWLHLATHDGTEVGDRVAVDFLVSHTSEGFVSALTQPLEMKVPRGTTVSWAHVYDSQFAALPLWTIPIRPPARSRDSVTFMG